MGRKLFLIKKIPYLSFEVLGRQVAGLYNHYIYRFDLDSLDMNKSETGAPEITARHINLDCLYLCEHSTFAVREMRQYLTKQEQFVDGFLFVNSNQELLGYLWVMYRGGNENQYRVRNSEAFLFDIYVSEAHRGKGICGCMLKWMFLFLREKHIKLVRLAVRTNNTSAIKAYEKAGGLREKQSCFVQFFRRFNVPYYKV